MAPGRARRKGYDPLTEKPLPTRVIASLWISGVLTAGTLCLEAARALGHGDAGPPPEVALLTGLLGMAAVCFIAWSMEFRDELEVRDGPRMAGAFVLVMAAHACRLLGISWAALILESLALIVLAARNSLGLPVALKQGRLKKEAVAEKSVLPACLAAAVLLLCVPRVRQAHGGWVALAAAAHQAAVLGGVLVALAATSAERFTQAGMRDMLRGIQVQQWGAAALALSLTVQEGQALQVGSAALSHVLCVVAYAFISTSAYRRTPLPSKGIVG